MRDLRPLMRIRFEHESDRQTGLPIAGGFAIRLSARAEVRCEEMIPTHRHLPGAATSVRWRRLAAEALCEAVLPAHRWRALVQLILRSSRSSWR